MTLHIRSVNCWISTMWIWLTGPRKTLFYRKIDRNGFVRCTRHYVLYLENMELYLCRPLDNIHGNDTIVFPALISSRVAQLLPLRSRFQRTLGSFCFHRQQKYLSLHENFVPPLNPEDRFGIMPTILSPCKNSLICSGAHRELWSGMNPTPLFVMFLLLGEDMLLRLVD